MSDPSYLLVRVKPPPEQINDKVAFTFNNLSFANLSQKVRKQILFVLIEKKQKRLCSSFSRQKN